MNEEEIKIPTQNKNLFDSIEVAIQKQIDFAHKNNEAIIGVSMNENTKKYLESKHIYGFKSYISENIPIIINNNLANYIIEFHSKKNSKTTPYVEYKVKE